MASLRYLIRRFIQESKDKGYRLALVKATAYLADIFTTYFNIFLIFLVRSRSPKQLRQRIEVLRRFRAIHQGSLHPYPGLELLFIADEILRIPPAMEGDIIECGVFKGGSTCKLSIIAKLVGRRLIACDSFQGLPKPRDFDAVHIRTNGRKDVYKEGDYQGTLEEVRANLNRFGEPDVVSLVPGWFHETLPTLRHQKFVCIFIDVDLYDSIVCCLQNLWPALQPGCKLFTHEAPHELTVKAFTDQAFWRTNFGHTPPPFIGGGTGLGPRMCALGYIQKSPVPE